MLVSAAITHIRNLTGHDVDGQVNDSTMLLPWIEQETRRARRRLSMAVPEMYLTIVGPVTIAAGQSAITIAAALGAFERIMFVERRLRGSGVVFNDPNDVWAEVPLYTEGSPYLGYREEAGFIHFYPERLAPGAYRVKYVLGITGSAFTTSTDLNTVSGTGGGLPQGLEEVVIQRVCALVATRVPGDDPAPHQAEAERIWSEQIRALRMRYGQSIKPGFRRLSRIG